MTESAHAAAMAGSDSDPLLALQGISKSFGPVEALKDVDLEPCIRVRSSASSETTGPESRR